jgi:hypothetical protein
MNEGTPTYATIVPLERADCRAEDQPDREGDHPRQRVVEPDPLGQPVVLDDRHGHADGGHHRSRRTGRCCA